MRCWTICAPGNLAAELFRIFMGLTVGRPGMKAGPLTLESRITPSPRRIVRLLVAAALTLGGVQGATGQPTPTGEAVMAWPVTISPTWFDPSTAPPQITPFGMLYALHDALVRPLPGQKMGNSLASCRRMRPYAWPKIEV